MRRRASSAAKNTRSACFQHNLTLILCSVTVDDSLMVALSNSKLRLVSPPDAVTETGEVWPSGKLIELSGEGATASSTMAASIVRLAQSEGEPGVWIQPQDVTCLPGDLADNGLDLEALVIVHVPLTDYAVRACRVAELLLRSGGFGIVVLELREHVPSTLGHAWQGRLLGLARQHRARIVVITRTPKQSASLGPLVTLRVESERERIGRGRFSLGARVLKNKNGIHHDGSQWTYRGPWGLL